MLCYYSVLVTKNRGKNSRFPEYHWVASSMIYAFHPTTFFQLGVYDGPIAICGQAFCVVGVLRCRIFSGLCSSTK